MKKSFLLTIILSIVVFMPTISASNDNPTVKSEILKDGSLDFDITLSDMNIDPNTKYRWTIVRTQASDPCSDCWSYPVEWTSTSMKIHLDFSDSDIRNNLNYVDKVYLIVKEEDTDKIISNHIVIDVSIPYAYGLIPYQNEYDQWTVSLNGTLSSIFSNVYISAVEITDEKIINDYLKIKKDGLDKEELATFINDLNLTENDVPKEWQSSVRKSSTYGITNNSLYFVWSKVSEYQASGGKNIYGVTIYDNGYSEKVEQSNKAPDTGTQNTEVTDTKEISDITENPKTGINFSLSISFVVLMGAMIIYIVVRRKNKFKNI